MYSTKQVIDELNHIALRYTTMKSEFIKALGINPVSAMINYADTIAVIQYRKNIADRLLDKVQTIKPASLETLREIISAEIRNIEEQLITAPAQGHHTHDVIMNMANDAEMRALSTMHGLCKRFLNETPQ